MPDLLSLLDWVSALLFAGAIGMSALSSKEIRAAKGITWIALALFVVRWSIWGMTTDQPTWLRLLVGAIVGAFLFAIIPPVFALMTRKIAVEDSGKPKIDSASASLYIDCLPQEWENLAWNLVSDNFVNIGYYQANQWSPDSLTVSLSSGLLTKENRPPSGSHILVKCLLTFFSSEKIIDVKLDNSFLFHLADRTGGSLKAGQQVGQEYVAPSIYLRMPDLSRKYVFYFFARNIDAYMSASFQKSFNYRTLSDETIKHGRIVLPTDPFSVESAMPSIKPNPQDLITLGPALLKPPAEK